jgi:hydroxymethylbilane synthase
VILGTRGSELALAQAHLVEQALGDRASIETKIIRTSGDERKLPLDPIAGRKGMFTREIERALLEREIDLAVHSAKDLPSDMTAGLEIAAVLPRGPAGDVLISKESALKRIGTSSVRRQHQIRAKWPTVAPVELRGNVPTRLRKLADSAELDAIILARAGITRLVKPVEFQMHDLPLDEFVPAGGQGIIAIQIRSGDARTREVIERIDHAETHSCLRAEREFLRMLQADCNSPVGVHATIDSGVITMQAQVFDNEKVRVATARGAAPAEVAAQLLEKLNG